MGAYSTRRLGALCVREARRGVGARGAGLQHGGSGEGPEQVREAQGRPWGGGRGFQRGCLADCCWVHCWPRSCEHGKGMHRERDGGCECKP